MCDIHLVVFLASAGCVCLIMLNYLTFSAFGLHEGRYFGMWCGVVNSSRSVNYLISIWTVQFNKDEE